MILSHDHNTGGTATCPVFMGVILCEQSFHLEAVSPQHFLLPDSHCTTSFNLVRRKVCQSQYRRHYPFLSYRRRATSFRNDHPWPVCAPPEIKQDWLMLLSFLSCLAAGIQTQGSISKAFPIWKFMLSRKSIGKINIHYRNACVWQYLTPFKWKNSQARKWS